MDWFAKNIIDSWGGATFKLLWGGRLAYKSPLDTTLQTTYMLCSSKADMTKDNILEDQDILFQMAALLVKGFLFDVVEETVELAFENAGDWPTWLQFALMS